MGIRSRHRNQMKSAAKYARRVSSLSGRLPVRVFIVNATKREAIFVQFLAGGALECFVLILSANRLYHFSFSSLVDCLAWAAVPEL